jgi:hypothetical protein
MDVTSFLCVSLGSSTDQLHDNLRSRRAGYVQRLVSVVKMATVLEECSVVHFFGAKGLIAKDINKKGFLFTVRSVCGLSGSHLGR